MTTATPNTRSFPMIRTAIAATALAATAVLTTATGAQAAPYTGAIPVINTPSPLVEVVGTNATGYDLTYANGVRFVDVPTRRAALNDCDGWYPGGVEACKTYRKALYAHLAATRDALARAAVVNSAQPGAYGNGLGVLAP